MDNLLWALVGRCPNCGRGSMYAAGVMKVAATCAHCHVRFERYPGSWTIPVVMGYTSAALVGFGLIFYYQWRGTLAEHDTVIMVASVLTGLLVYPTCKNISLFMLWNNGFMTVDPPTLVRDDDAPLRVATAIPVQVAPAGAQAAPGSDEDPDDGPAAA
jgi:uncharacterized protein (DUF983 family)